MRNFSRTFTAFTPLVLCFSFTANAQTQLADVVVTASRAEQNLADALPHTTVITAQAIRESLARDVPSLLASQAGIQITRNGGFGASGGLFMRGASSAQVLVLLDGIALTKQDASGGVSLEHIALETIERVELVRGNVSAIYGSGAIGGVIQLFTRKGNKAFTPAAGLEIGTHGAAKAYASIGGEHNGVSVQLGVSSQKTKGFSAINTQQLATANPDRDGYENQSVSGQLGYRFNDAHRVGVRLLSNTGRFEFDSAFGAPGDIHHGRTTMRQLGLDTQHQFTQAWKATVQLADHREQNRNAYGGAFGFDDAYTTRTRMLQWNNHIKLSGQWQANLGVEKQWQSIDADDGFGGLYAVPRQTLALFGGAQWKTESLALQTNIRHDRSESASGQPDQNKTTGLLGVGWQLAPSWRASAMVSSAFNLAPLGYLYAPFFGNANLAPETATSAELGVQYQGATQLVNARLFSTRLRNQWEYDFVTNTFSNLSATRNRGVEVSANGTLAVVKGLSYRSSLTWQDPRDTITGQTLNRRAKLLASIGATQQWSDWQVGADAQFSGKRSDTVAPTGTVLGSYAVVNLRVGYQLAKELQLVVGVRNLFDRTYQSAFGFNTERRSAVVGVRYSGSPGSR
jgi:vitamin B12 transporter